MKKLLLTAAISGLMVTESSALFIRGQIAGCLPPHIIEKEAKRNGNEPDFNMKVEGSGDVWNIRSRASKPSPTEELIDAYVNYESDISAFGLLCEYDNGRSARLNVKRCKQ